MLISDYELVFSNSAFADQNAVWSAGTRDWRVASGVVVAAARIGISYLWGLDGLDTVYAAILTPVIWVIAAPLVFLPSIFPDDNGLFGLLFAPHLWLSLLIASMLCQNLLARLVIVLIRSFRKRA